ncbi:MAG: flagellar basal-body MS-ring/collar protein FliF [Kineosporiaceae bacterium]
MSARMNQAMGRARGLAGGFTPGQRGIILVAMAALVLGAIALTNWVAQPTWTPLFTQLSGADANAIVEELRGQNVQYQLADGGATVMVPQSQVYDLRVSMSGKGLPGKSGGEGWSLLDKQGMTATDFQQNINYQRALEGELNKTLGSITGVNTAVVRLAIPKRDVFASEQDKPTAAVLLALAPGTTLDKGQIRSVTHLVAGSVPGLDPSQVTVSDGNGAMLSTPENGAGTGGAAGIANDADEQTAQYEDRLSHAVQQMLDRVVGQGNAVVRVNAQLNYDTRHSTSESYLPSPVIPLSEQTSRETYGSSGNAAGGVLGVVTPSPIASPSGTGGYLKEAATRNNGVGKVITEEQAAPGGIERLTAAVILNADASGAADTAKIQALVSSALGVDSTRGDLVTVDTMPFDKTTAEATKKEIAAAASAAKTAGYIDLGKKAGLGLLVLIVAILVMMKSKGSGGASVDASASDLPDGMLMPSRLEAIGADRLRELGPGAGGTAMGGMIDSNPALERDKLRGEVSSFVDSQPEEIAQLVQGWLSQRNG